MTNRSLDACVICGEAIGVESGGWASGHNADPKADGYCCENCNLTEVVPARMKADGVSDTIIQDHITAVRTGRSGPK